jgi:uncharacterized protein (TIGR00297 family)
VRVILGAGLSSAIAWAGSRRDSLTASGAVGAVFSGTMTTVRGGYGRAALLVGFFIASSMISRLPARNEDSFASYAAKGGQRDAWQVAANGGVSTLLATLGDDERHRLGYLGGLAAATGDTWATEIGRRYGQCPRDVLTLQPVSQGASGGVTSAGTMASLAGGVFIGSLAALAGIFDRAFQAKRWELVLTGAATGMTGSLVDSIIGATIQERRWCEQCEISTERVVHLCGARTSVAGGVPGINNDVVNLICTISGAATGMLIERLWSR